MNLRNVSALILASTLAVPLAGAQRLAKHWLGTAVVTNNGNDLTVNVPVELEVSATDGEQVRGAFVNGDQRSYSTGGSLKNGHLTLHFRSFARTLEGDVQGNTFTGTFGGARIKKSYTVTLHKDRDGKPGTVFAAAPASAAAKKGTTINGKWEIALNTKGRKSERAWSLDVEPFRGDGQIRAVIQKLDGDSGALYGHYDESTGEYLVSRFGDFGATAYSIQPKADGTLLVTSLRDPKESNVARRPADARRENLAPPTEATEGARMKNPYAPLQFQGPNLAGNEIHSTDAEFRNKVVIVAIGGSWCPNCHDEAPLLVDLYNKFHARGLEVVGLSFEEEDQLKDPERLRAFITRYHIPYTVLLMGPPDSLNDKLQGVEDLNSWPTSFYIGRDGLVKKIHTGFSGPATGAAYTQLRQESFALVEKLLEERAAAR